MANRQYKDSVFRKLFHNKRELASLYQAIRPEDDIRVHVIDISYDEANPYLKASPPLYGYSYLVYRVNRHKNEGDDDDTAIMKAILECKNAGILTEFLEKYGQEVLDMFKLQWNMKDAKKYWKEEAVAETTLKIIKRQLKRKADYAQIAEDTDTPIDEVIRIAKENHLAY